MDFKRKIHGNVMKSILCLLIVTVMLSVEFCGQILRKMLNNIQHQPGNYINDWRQRV